MLGSSTALAQADAYPSKVITLVVTYPPGGGADVMARLIAPKMSETLGQTIVIDNRPGAGGQIGAGFVAKAKADGYTLLFDASSFAANPALYPKLPYDSLKAFQPIGVTALFPNVVLVNANFPPKTVAELLTLAKSQKDGMSFASSGNGSAQHLAGALFESATGVDLVHVPYKGGGPALNDVVGGQVPLFFGNLASTLPHIQSGKLRPLAVTSAKRSPLLPDVPTLAEAGVKGAEMYEWNALFAPAATPAPTLGRPLRIKPLDDAAARDELPRVFPPAFIEAQMRFFAKGEFDDKRAVSTVHDITGRSPRSFIEWAHHHSDAFRWRTFRPPPLKFSGGSSGRSV